MRFLFIAVTLLTFTSTFSQTRGNGSIVTETFDLENVEHIEISLYADVTIDVSGQKEYIQITADENIIRLIDKEVVDGKLNLNQIKWIQASQKMKVTISAPSLTLLTQGTHDATYVTGVEKSEFTIQALIGKITLEGQSEELRIMAEQGEVDAIQFEASEIVVNAWGPTKINLGKANVVSGKMTDNGILSYTSIEENNLKVRGDSRVGTPAELANKTTETRYIDVKIKNNSSNRLQAYVRGPKPEGRYFSYGFPMRPGQVKKEKWTIGTKVYKKSVLGRKELIELTAKDEGEVVYLFDKSDKG